MIVVVVTDGGGDGGRGSRDNCGDGDCGGDGAGAAVVAGFLIRS